MVHRASDEPAHAASASLRAECAAVADLRRRHRPQLGRHAAEEYVAERYGCLTCLQKRSVRVVTDSSIEMPSP